MGAKANACGRSTWRCRVKNTDVVEGVWVRFPPVPPESSSATINTGMMWEDASISVQLVATNLLYDAYTLSFRNKHIRFNFCRKLSHFFVYFVKRL